MEIRKSEEINKKSLSIHNFSTLKILKTINNEDLSVPKIIKNVLKDVAQLTDEIVKTLENGGRIIYMGSGSSGDIAYNDAQEVSGTYGVPFNTFRAIHLQLGINKNWEKLEEYKFKKRNVSEDEGKQTIIDLKDIKLSKKDLVIGISASGTTLAIIEGLKWAKKLGCVTASIAMNINSKISEGVDVSIELSSGPEVVAGSTRMKAGSATKMILNMLSTASMIKMGNVFKGMMVGVVVPNDGNLKIEKRAIDIVSKITKLNFNEAEVLFNKSNKNIKVAIVSNELNVSVKKAVQILNEKKWKLQDTL